MTRLHFLIHIPQRKNRSGSLDFMMPPRAVTLVFCIHRPQKKCWILSTLVYTARLESCENVHYFQVLLDPFSLELESPARLYEFFLRIDTTRALGTRTAKITASARGSVQEHFSGESGGYAGYMPDTSKIIFRPSLEAFERGNNTMNISALSSRREQRQTEGKESLRSGGGLGSAAMDGNSNWLSVSLDKS